MQLGTFEATCIIGAVLIIGTSWEKYQQPSIKGKKRHLYERFRPQLVTSNTRYYVSMLGYNLLMLGFYALLVLVKDSQNVIELLGFENNASAESFPLIAAMAIMGAQNLPYINKLEAVVRSWCHAWAKVPRGARQTRDEIAEGGFNFAGYINDGALKSDQLQYVEKEDFEKGKATTELKWARISCVLFSLERARNKEAEGDQFSMRDIDATLFEEYEEEYEQMLQSHRALGSAIEAFKNRKKSDAAWKRSDDFRKLRESLHKDMGRLDEQLTSFVACAVRSKHTTESQVKISLAKLGFILADIPRTGISIDSVIIILAIIFAIAVGTVIVSQSLIFNPLVTELSNAQKIIPVYIPRQMLDALIWGLFTIIAHGSAIAGSHYYRRFAIRRKMWPVWTGAQKRARVSQYFLAAVMGGFFGTIALFLLGIVHHVLVHKMNAPVLENGNEYLVMSELILIWAFTYCVTALFTAIHLDTTNNTISSIAKWTGIQSLTALTVVSVLATVFIDEYHKIYSLDDSYVDIENQFKLVVVVLVTLISMAMAISMPSLHISNCKKEEEQKERDAAQLMEEESGYAAELK